MTENIEVFAKGLPSVFITFYQYVVSLNYDDDINFFYWKTHLSRILTADIVCRPYRFLLKKHKGAEIDEEAWVDTDTKCDT